MRIILNYFLLFSILVCGTAAKADSDTLFVCRKKVEALAQNLQIEVTPGAGDNIRQCIEDFLKLSSGENFINTEEDCTWKCYIESKGISFYGAKGYTKLLRNNLNEEKIKTINNYLGAGRSFEGRVKESYDVFIKAHSLEKILVDYKGPKMSSVEKEKASQEIGFKGLKFIILDIINVHVKAEVYAMGINLNTEEVKNEAVAVEVASVLRSLRKCLSISKTSNHIQICANKFKQNAPYRIGRVVLTYYLEEFFKDKFTDDVYREISEQTFHDYAACGVDYYFNENNSEITEKIKVRSCAYVSLTEAFLKAIGALLSAHIEIDRASVEELVHNCKESYVFNREDKKRYEYLGLLSPDDFQEILLDCEKKATVNGISKVGRIKILEHASVRAVVKASDLEAFAEEVISEGIPGCIALLPAGKSPEKCENYLFSVSAKKLFSRILKEKINAYKTKFKFLEHIDLTEVVADGTGETSKCIDELYLNAVNFFNRSRQETEIELANCVRVGIIVALQIPMDSYISEELDENEILKKYNIFFLENDREEIKKGFNSCILKNISTEKGFESILETSETFLNTCIVKTMKKVVLENLELILKKELRTIGFSSAETERVIGRYKKTEKNIIKSIETSSTQEEISWLLLRADKDIIKSIAPDVIKLLIRKESPIKFSGKNEDAMVKEGEIQLLRCLKDRELKDCTETVKEETTAFGIRLLLPGMVRDEMVKVLKPLLSGDQSVKNKKIKGLKLLALFKNRVNKENGVKLSEYLAKRLLKGGSVEKIKKNKRLLSFVYESLNSSPRTMKHISFYLIQPQIYKKAQVFGISLRVITRDKYKRALNWMSISTTTSGKKAYIIFKKYLKKALVEDASIDFNEVAEEMSDLLKSGYSEYRKIIKKHCAGISKNVCFQKLDKLDSGN